MALVSFLTIGLKRVTKIVQIKKKLFFYTSKRSNIFKKTFEKEVSNKLAPKIKPSILRQIDAIGCWDN